MSETNKPNTTSLENNTEKKPSRRNFLIGATMGAAGLLGAGAAGVAIGRGSGEKPPVGSQLPTETNQPTETVPETTKPVETESPVEVDPYAEQAWGGIEPGLEGEELVEALSIPRNATPEEAAEFFVETDLNFMLMGHATPDEAQKYADLDPYVYMMSDEFKKPLISEMLSKKKSMVDAVYSPDVVDEYTYDTPLEANGFGDSQVFNSLMASSKALYCISYNDPTASEPYKLQFEAIMTDVTEEGEFSVLVNIINTLDESGDDVSELVPDYIESSLLYDLPKRAVVYGWLEEDEASGRYKISQPSMEPIHD